MDSDKEKETFYIGYAGLVSQTRKKVSMNKVF